MRAREPDLADAVVRDGVRIAFEVHGTGDPTVLLMPTWSIVHSGHWKAQIAFLSRHHRVVVVDPPGNGASHRSTRPGDYADRRIAADVLAVMDATGTARAVVAGVSCGARYALHLAAAEPQRVAGIIAIAPSLPFIAPPNPARAEHKFSALLDTDEGWAKENRHYWLRDWRGYLEFFFEQCFAEPHSFKQVEDAVEWGLQTTPEIMLLTECDLGVRNRDEAEELCRRVACPVLVIHGDQDAISPLARGERFAELTGGTLVTIAGGGHLPQARDPVRVNDLMTRFARSVAGTTDDAGSWIRPHARHRRALFVSSPIGLGHARRDIAVARELRRLVPGLEIDWLAQSPVTEALVAAGERVHPMSRHLASESRHIESEAGRHELDVFGAFRRMDEILVANYMVFRDLVRAEQFDLWIGDEAWEVDHFLHENPEDKRAAYVWLTDFVGWLPMAEGGERERVLTADLNAWMLEQIDRFPRIRDRSIFIGDLADVVDAPFGPGLPRIDAWTQIRYDFAGQVTGSAPVGDRAALRREWGIGDEETVVVAAAGGSGVGTALLELAAAAHGPLRERLPGLRTIVVAGPRIDARALAVPDGVEVLGYVPDLDRLLAASDAAVVQGGLTTGMELVAADRPFVSFPLARHFEQRIHVRHRLARHGHEAALEFGDTDPDALARALHRLLAEPPSYRPVAPDGAARAAGLIAELV